jgi:hypothetical protein
VDNAQTIHSITVKESYNSTISIKESLALSGRDCFKTRLARVELS